MKTLYFETTIQSPRNQVYETMLGAETFKQWTAEFSPTSRYLGHWEKGSKILFLSDDPDGKVCGMVSQINENKPDTFVSIKHLGLLEDGKEIMDGEKVDAFSGALEEYTFTAVDGGTYLKIRMDAIPEWEDYFKETWPKALQKLKHLCEQQSS